MNRLTRRINGKVSYAPLEKGECVDIVDLCDVWGERLADYEDAEEQGLLIRLPQIKKYRTLYWVWGDAVMPVQYMGIRGGCVGKKGRFHVSCNMKTKKSRTFIHRGNSFTYKMGNDRMFYADDLGKTVFLTREEAEKALKEANRND